MCLVICFSLKFDREQYMESGLGHLEKMNFEIQTQQSELSLLQFDYDELAKDSFMPKETHTHYDDIQHDDMELDDSSIGPDDNLIQAKRIWAARIRQLGVFHSIYSNPSWNKSRFIH